MTESDPTTANEDPEVEQRERYRELLEELRTINPGVQVLFAFLLTVPFSPRFADVDPTGRIAFLVALLGTALAMVLFLTPASYHRIAPRSARDERIRLSVRLAVGGMAILGVAVTAGVFLVVRFVFGPDEARWIGAALAVAFLLLWYLLPLWRRRRLRGD